MNTLTEPRHRESLSADACGPEPKYFIEPRELSGIKQCMDKLLHCLQGEDLPGALSCIKEINHINDQSMFTIIGKITRGLHDAIADLNVSTHDSRNDKNKTRAGLGYVIAMTENAAKTTLDMTEHAQEQLHQLDANLAQQNTLIARLQTEVSGQTAALSELQRLASAHRAGLASIGHDVTEIVIAQNFQDLTSQSLTKIMRLIGDVETSLVSLTQYTKLLKQLSQYSDGTEILDATDGAALLSNLEKIERPAESEHMDQNDVDNLLSSLGF